MSLDPSYVASPRTPEHLLGHCYCGIGLRYNRCNDPYCERCDGLRIAAVCPGCGRPTENGVIEIEHRWFCADCGYYRDYEFSHYDMGRGCARPSIRKLFWACWRFCRGVRRNGVRETYLSLHYVLACCWINVKDWRR